MFNTLQDPNPPSPTKETRMAVTRRARRIKRRQVALATAGGLLSVVIVAVAGYALFATDEPTPVATEVQAKTESNPNARSTTSPTVAVTPPPSGVSTPGSPLASVIAAPPTTATLTVTVTAPAGFAITGCTIGGIAVGIGPTLVASGLAPGATDVVCDAATNDGAARAGRVGVVLVAGENSATLAL
jgi:hypothetical protein